MTHSDAITWATECLAQISSYSDKKWLKTDTITDVMLKDFKQLMRMFLRNKILSGTLLFQTLF